MGMNRYIIIFMTAVMISSCSSVSKSVRAERTDVAKREVKTNIDNKRFTIDVNMAHPSGGKSVVLSSSYDVRIATDSVYCHLPYFGRAYSLPYGGGEGLIFKGPTTDYMVEQGRGNSTNLSFNIRTSEDSYHFMMNIFSGGSSVITVQPNNKQAITFNGQMVMQQK